MNQYYAEQMYQLSNRLLDYGYTQAEIGQLTYDEILEVIKKSENPLEKLQGFMGTEKG